MIDAESFEKLKSELKERILSDRAVLEELREQVRPLRFTTTRIQPHSTTAISLVGTDGGNNKVQFDPFMVQVVRVVDSSNNEYCLEVVTPTSDIATLSQRHFAADGSGITPLGRLMNYLGVASLYDLTHMISRPPKPLKPSWVQVYRELMEWAVLFELVRNKDFATDTVIIWDGYLRTKLFRGELFKRFREGLEEGIANQYKRNRRRLHVASVIKHSRVLETYQLAMAIEGVLRNSYPSYVEVPHALEKHVFAWSEFARGTANEEGSSEGNLFVAGKMFFVKFGSSPHDPIWAVDLLESQSKNAQSILGYMLADALNGFPVPFYPQCLQRAHENAALTGFDMDILQDLIIGSIRETLGVKGSILDEFQLQDTDPSAKRYS